MPNILHIAKLEAQFNRAHISQHDFEEAEEYLNELAAVSGSVPRRALLTAAVVAYARPFTQNERGDESLATATVSTKPLKELSLEEMTIHQRVIALRHRAIAHSPYEGRPLERIGLHESGFVVNGSYFDVLDEGLNIATFKSASARLKLACRYIKADLNKQLFILQNAA
jgi:hypothetical protein